MSLYQSRSFYIQQEPEVQLYKQTNKKQVEVIFMWPYDHDILRASLLISPASLLVHWVGPSLDDLVY